MAKVKVTVTSSTKRANNSAMLGARTLKRHRDVFLLFFFFFFFFFSDQKMTLRAKVMVKATMTFRSASLLAMLSKT